MKNALPSLTACCLGLLSSGVAALTCLHVLASPPNAGTTVVVAGRPAPGEPAVAGELVEPFAVDLDAEGNLYIAEMEGGERVRKLDTAGQLATFAGMGKKGDSGDGGPADRAQINGMHHLLLGKRGDLMIADTWNNRIRRIDLATGVITNLAGTGQKGFSGDGGPATQAACGGVYCLALDAPGQHLYFADLDNRRVRVVTLADGKISTLAGNGQKGVPVDGAAAKESPLFDPRAVACGPDGSVYILERSGHALRVVDSQGTIRTVAGSGKAGPVADDVPAAEATFNGPKHLFVDRAGDVLICDTENHAIVKFLPKKGRVVRIAGTGKKGHGGIGGPPRSLELNRPHGIFESFSGDLYISDSSNGRIIKIPAETAR
ncbi:MAG: hypothetical protein AB7O62_23100 [Pirellulales bacterium]